MFSQQGARAVTKDIPPTIKKYLQQVLDEGIEVNALNWDCKPNWNPELTFKFWLINDDDELVNFLRCGLTSAIAKMADDHEESWQKSHNYPEDDNDDHRAARKDALLANFPPIYGAIDEIFHFLSACNLCTAIEAFEGWGADGIKYVVEACRVLGLKQLGLAYQAAINYKVEAKEKSEDDDIYCMLDAFESVTKFSINRQCIEMVQVIRKNYQLFLV